MDPSWRGCLAPWAAGWAEPWWRATAGDVCFQQGCSQTHSLFPVPVVPTSGMAEQPCWWAGRGPREGGGGGHGVVAKNTQERSRATRETQSLTQPGFGYVRLVTGANWVSTFHPSIAQEACFSSAKPGGNFPANLEQRFAEPGCQKGTWAVGHAGPWVPHSLYVHLVPVLHDWK